MDFVEFWNSFSHVFPLSFSLFRSPLPPEPWSLSEWNCIFCFWMFHPLPLYLLVSIMLLATGNSTCWDRLAGGLKCILSKLTQPMHIQPYTVYTCIYIYIHIHTHTHIYIDVYQYVYIYIYTYVCVYKNMQHAYVWDDPPWLWVETQQIRLQCGQQLHSQHKQRRTARMMFGMLVVYPALLAH